MNILNFGSLNIDLVYQVEHIARPGETIASSSHQVFAGGKGANQSAALARAGARVFHAGQVGPDGQWLVDKLAGLGVDVQHIRVGDVPTGHAIIQVDRQGQNSIVLFAGANARIDRGAIDTALSHFDKRGYPPLAERDKRCLLHNRHSLRAGSDDMLKPRALWPGSSRVSPRISRCAHRQRNRSHRPCGCIGAYRAGLALPPRSDRTYARGRWRPVPLPVGAIRLASTTGRSSRYDRCGRHFHRLFSPGPDRRHDGARRHSPRGASRGPVRHPPGSHGFNSSRR